MKWAEISIATTHGATEAVANVLHEAGAGGVVIEDPELINSYRCSGNSEYGDLPAPEDLKTVVVKAYLPVDAALNTRIARLQQAVNNIVCPSGEAKAHVSWCEVCDEDWENTWKQYFHATRVGSRIVIQPTWEGYEPLDNDLVIRLDPGTAFGSGTHYTTAMCIECLEEYIKPGMRVFDVGTGSGVLALAAAKLGADAVTAVDLDDVAVRTAGANVKINALSDRVQVMRGDLLTGLAQADVIVANIIADVIIKMAPDVLHHLTAGGILIASGVITDRLADVTDALSRNGLIVDAFKERGNWGAIVARGVN